LISNLPPRLKPEVAPGMMPMDRDWSAWLALSCPMTYLRIFSVNRVRGFFFSTGDSPVVGFVLYIYRLFYIIVIIYSHYIS
jgi:hypothetical protein